jgi:hypothetical protein
VRVKISKHEINRIPLFRSHFADVSHLFFTQRISTLNTYFLLEQRTRYIKKTDPLVAGKNFNSR